MHLTVLDAEQKFFAMLNKLRKFFTMTRKFNSENYYFKYRDLSEHKNSRNKRNFRFFCVFLVRIKI